MLRDSPEYGVSSHIVVSQRSKGRHLTSTCVRILFSLFFLKLKNHIFLDIDLTFCFKEKRFLLCLFIYIKQLPVCVSERACAHTFSLKFLLIVWRTMTFSHLT